MPPGTSPTFCRLEELSCVLSMIFTATWEGREQGNVPRVRDKGTQLSPRHGGTDRVRDKGTQLSPGLSPCNGGTHGVRDKGTRLSSGLSPRHGGTRGTQAGPFPWWHQRDRGLEPTKAHPNTSVAPTGQGLSPCPGGTHRTRLTSHFSTPRWHPWHKTCPHAAVAPTGQGPEHRTVPTLWWHPQGKDHDPQHQSWAVACPHGVTLGHGPSP